jgi:nitrate/TMAO reductase-like tetraheme cytochrome c subunit
MTVTRLFLPVLALLLVPLFTGTASAQQSYCADCHYANPSAPRPDHLEEWDRSPHGRNRVGCEKCHGGNATAIEGFRAHAGVLNSADDFSSASRRNLPLTCGQCHAAPSVAFESSRHYELLRSGSSHGPTCSTCHGAVDGRVLSPKALASKCGECHGPDEVAPRAGRVQAVREQYEGITAVREQVKQAQSLIKRVTDRRRRADLTSALDRAQAPLVRAVEAGHKFVYDDLKVQLEMAQQRVEALLNMLANR